MRRRLFTALGIAALGGCALLPARAAGLGSPLPSTCAPVVSGVSAPGPQQQPEQYGPAGVTVTVSGVDLGGPACPVQSVQVGSAQILPGAQGLTSSADGTSVTFTLPDKASGAVSVTVADALGDSATSNSNLVFLETPASAVTAPTPVEHSTETLSGSNLAPFEPQASGGLPGATVSGVYEGCAAPQSFPVSVQSDDAASLPAPGTYCDGSLVLGFDAPADTTRPMDCTDSPSNPAYNCIPIEVSAGGVDVDFFISSAEPAPGSSVPVGQPITVRGSGFGPSGSASIAGLGVAAQWSDSQVTLTVPSGAVSGVLVLQRTTGDGQAVPVGMYAIEPAGSPVVPPNPGGGSTSGGAGDVGAPAAPTAAAARAGRADVAVAPTALEDVLTLRLNSTTAKPGAAVRFTVSLTLDGKPVSGAPVTVTLLAAPGKDAFVKPAGGTTSAAGTFTAVLHLSGTAGKHLLLARSGVYSDEAMVLGVAPQQKAGGIVIGPLHIHIGANPIVVGLSIITALLMFAGLVVNVDVFRRVLWSATGRPVLRRLRDARA